MNLLSLTKHSVIFLGLIFIGCVTRSFGQTYQITDLGTLPGEATSTAVAINQSGQIAGNSGARSFIYQNGTMTDLGMPTNSNLVVATGINNPGDVVGYYVPNYSPYQSPLYGFIWHKGSISDPFNSSQLGIGDVLFRGISPAAINDAGEVALNDREGSFSVTDTFLSGELWTGPGMPFQIFNPPGQAVALNNKSQALDITHPYYSESYIWTQKTAVALGDFPSGNGDVGFAINDSGQVVGEAGLSNGSVHAFSYSDGALSDLGTLGGLNSSARALNNVGQIVGDSDPDPNSTSSPNRHAFLYTNGSMVDLNAQVANISGWELTSAVGVNDTGEIVGNGNYLGSKHSFLLTPIAQVTVSPNRGGNAGTSTLVIYYPGQEPTEAYLTCAGEKIVGTSLTPLGSLCAGG